MKGIFLPVAITAMLFLAGCGHFGSKNKQGDQAFISAKMYNEPETPPLKKTPRE